VPRGYRESACLQDTQHLSSTLVVCRDWFHMLAAIPGWPHLRSQAQRSSTAVHTYRKQILVKSEPCGLQWLLLQEVVTACDM
jgi:hypothetical protein